MNVEELADFPQCVAMPVEGLPHRHIARQPIVTRGEQCRERGADGKPLHVCHLLVGSVRFQFLGHLRAEGISAKEERIRWPRIIASSDHKPRVRFLRLRQVRWIECLPHLSERQEPRRCAEAGCRSVTAPFPRRRVLDDLRLYWIHHDVTKYSVEVYVSIDHQRLKSALENMPNASMPTVKELAVRGIQLLHHARQRDLVWCQQQMEMRIHLAVRETIDAESIERIGERGKERLTILNIEEDLLLGVST